jgi:hypothetical protein
MVNVLTTEQKAKILKVIFGKADAFGYSSSGRKESGRFIDGLVDDPDVGGVLSQYMAKERIRTYIKDGILNAYTKNLKKKALAAASPTDAIQQIYGVQSSVIHKGKGKEARVSVSRADNGEMFVVSGGTVIKWETALRKALEIIARLPGLTVDGITPSICLCLADVSQILTDGDKKHITDALTTIGVQAIFCNSLLI